MTGWKLPASPVARAIQEPVPKPPLEVPDVVPEGGVLVIQVNTAAKEIGLVVPGHGTVLLPVPKDGRVEWRVPPDVPGGSTITVIVVVLIIIQPIHEVCHALDQWNTDWDHKGFTTTITNVVVPTAAAINLVAVYLFGVAIGKVIVDEKIAATTDVCL